VIIGAGFGGLAAAKALRHAKAEIWVIDRANHNLFQPLLYQVATTVLSPAQIASPIRELLKNQRNATVFLGEVTGINKDAKFVYVSNEDHKDAPIRYDILIVATGVTHSYFGHDEFAEFAPGLKELADAVRIRNKVLKAFERAEAEDNPSLRQDLLTFVLVGAGPTGTELAASLAVPVRTKLKAEFRRVNLAATRVVLIDMAPRVLGSFSPELSEAAKSRLENLGVEVRLGHGVDQIDADGGCRRRRAYQKQCRHLDGGSSPISSGKMAERGHGPRRPRSYSERSQRSRTPRHLRTRRHSFARTGRKTAAWCRPSGYSTRPLCWASHRSRLAW
jgi:NADH dehydrogenase FAD-containing subunit